MSGLVEIEGCSKCTPALDPDGEREDDHHFSVRFPGHHRALVTVDGGHTILAFEVWAGSPGRVIEYPTPIQLCPCGGGPFRQLVRYDKVVVEMIEAFVTPDRKSDAWGDYQQVWACDQPATDVRFQVVEDEWNEAGTVRTIKAIRLI